jgi:hypothetical protein
MRRFNRVVHRAAAAQTRGARTRAQAARAELAELRIRLAGFLANWDLDHEKNLASVATQIEHLRRNVFTPKSR